MISVVNAEQKYHKTVTKKNAQFSVDADEQAVMHF
jgi:hypothetical protein